MEIVYLVSRGEGKTRQSRQEDKCLDHLELCSLGITAVAEDNAWTEDCERGFRQELPDHVLAELFRAGVGIVVRALPINRPVFNYHFILPLARDCDRTHVAEAAQAVVVVRFLGKEQYLQSAAQVDIEAAFLGLAIQRSSTVDD